MKNVVIDNNLVVYLEGQVDTTNAEAVGDEIVSIREGHPEGTLVLDAENLKYISSAGLRQILKLKKANKEFKIINVNNEIYEIFDMTGFTEMMDIEKGYRTLSVDGCEIIGEGSNGVVYRLNPDTIIKVYKNNDALSEIKRERELARTALVMGVNTAIPYDVVKVDGMFGSVFELIDCKSITKWILEDPDNKEEYIKVFVDMLKEIHSTDVKPGLLPSEKKVALGWTDYLKGHIDDEHLNKLVKLVDEVPESDKMIHGDYHSNNVHYNKKESILIDMDTIAVGNPIFEFGCIYNAYQGFGITDHTRIEKFLKLSYDTATEIFTRTVQLYFGVDDITDVLNKCKVVGLTRVLRRTLKREPENTELIEESKKQLLEAIDAVDSIII